MKDKKTGIYFISANSIKYFRENNYFDDMFSKINFFSKRLEQYRDINYEPKNGCRTK